MAWQPHDDQINELFSFSFFFSFSFVSFFVVMMLNAALVWEGFADIEFDQMITSDSLEVVDLRKNPLTPQCLDRLKNARVTFHIELSERIIEDWEDLTI